MKRSLACWFALELVIVGTGQAMPAHAEPPHERDLAVDQVLGGLEEGSRMLAPRGHGAAKSHSGVVKPGGTTTPGDAGAVKSGFRGAGVTKPDRGRRSTGSVGSRVGTIPSASGGGGTQTSGAQGGGGVGGATGPETGTSNGSPGGGSAGPGNVEEPGGVSGSETSSEPSAGGGTGGGTDTESPGTGASNNLIDLNLDANPSAGEVDTGLSVGGEPVIEADVSTGTDLSGTADTVTADTDATLDAGVVTDTTTIDASTETTEGSLTVDVSAGSDTLGDALLGTGSELDPDAATAEETTDILDDCSTLDPLSIPEHCL